MGIFDSILSNGVSAIGDTVGKLANSIRTAITGNEAITSEERQKIFDATHELETIGLNADVAINAAQTRIDEIEAQSPSLFKSGWRPGLAWVCIFGFAYMTILRPILPWVLHCFNQALPDMPPIDTSTLMQLLFALLGLGGYRTWEKIKGVASN